MKAQAAGRLERLRNAAAENGIRTFLVRDTASIEWLTAFDGVFDDEQAHALPVLGQVADTGLNLSLIHI